MWVNILLLFFVFSFAFRTDFAFDQDLGRHLKLGEIIVKSHQIPNTNLFSYTNPNFPFINSHWLFEVWAYLMNKLPGGVESLLTMKLVIILGTVFLILKIIPREKRALLLPVGFIFLHVLRERLELRPEIFSFLFTGLTLVILERFIRQKTGWVYILPFIQLIWINTHIYFFVGLVLQAIYLLYIGVSFLGSRLDSRKLKILSAVFALSIIASLINPNGLAGFLFPLNVTKNYGYTIEENQTMFLLESIGFSDPNFLFVKLSVGLAVLSIILALLRKKFDSKKILLALFGCILALLNVRSFPYLLFLTFPATLWSLRDIKPNRLTRFLTAFAGLLLILESFLYLNGSYYRNTNSPYKPALKEEASVKKGMNFVLAHNLPAPIYNNFDIGSYIIYRGYPKYQVFVDGRPEAYPAQFLQDVYIPMQADYSKFKAAENKWGFKTIIFSHTDQTPWAKSFLSNLVKDPSWKTVYIDDFTIVLVKENVAKSKNLSPIDLSKLTPDEYNFESSISYLREGVFLYDNGFTEAGNSFIGKAGPVNSSSFFW